MKKTLLIAVLVAFTSIAFAATGDGSKKSSSSKKSTTVKVMKRKTSKQPSKDMYKMRDAKTKEAKKNGVYFAKNNRAAKKHMVTAKSKKKGNILNLFSKKKAGRKYAKLSGKKHKCKLWNRGGIHKSC